MYKISCTKISSRIVLFNEKLDTYHDFTGIRGKKKYKLQIQIKIKIHL